MDEDARSVAGKDNRNMEAAYVCGLLVLSKTDLLCLPVRVGHTDRWPEPSW